MSELATKKIIKGQNLRLFVGSKCIALATSCSLSLTNALEAVDTKDSTGGWSEQEVTGKSWSVSCDALFAVGTDAGNLYKDLATSLIAGTKVAVKLETTKGDQNRTTDDVNVFALNGNAFIAELSLNAPNKTNASWSVSLTGDGALTIA